MRGYWKRPELTALVLRERADGPPWYATGDIVVRDDDGMLWFRGRRDHQVKIRGVRLELEAVESVLGDAPGVAHAVAAPSGPHGDADRPAQVFCLHPPDQAVGDIHRDAADDVVAEMLGDLDDQIILLIVDGGIGDGDGVHDVRELSFLERQIDDRPDDLHYLSDVHTRLLK
jgi:acyl-CoA synthetase (AMP-forming)/AMP-acid ligase II